MTLNFSIAIASISEEPLLVGSPIVIGVLPRNRDLLKVIVRVLTGQREARLRLVLIVTWKLLLCL
jgi:hypothetical protein